MTSSTKFKNLNWVILLMITSIYTSKCNNSITLPGSDSETQVSIGGVVSGLAVSESVTLQNNGTDSVIVSGSGTGSDSFEFGTQLGQGESYSVEVTSQPITKECVVGGNTGVAGTTDIMTVSVTCSTSVALYTITGTVSGLDGSGLVLRNNGSDPVNINGNGAFTFPGVLTDGAAYAVTVSQQPSFKAQICSVSGGDDAIGGGTIAGANIDTISVNCVTQSFVVSGTVTGLNGGDTVTLQNNTANDQTVNGSGGFSFPAQLDGASYSVSILNYSGPTNCTISNNAGTISGADKSNVAVNCTYGVTYSLGGTLSGLAGGAMVVIKNTFSSELLPLTANGGFTFTTVYGDGQSYDVVVNSQPSNPKQTCTVTGGDDLTGGGVISGANETSVVVTCVTNQYAVGVTVTGLTGGDSITLQNNSGDDKTATSGSPSFSFTSQDDLSIYNVTILTPPAGKMCTVSSGLGLISGVNPSVTVTCGASPTYTIGGVITGLVSGGTGVTLSNGFDTTNFTANGSFSFPTAKSDSTAYTVSISSQPTNPGEVCSVTNASGTISGSNVTTVVITCAVNMYSVGGTINWNGNTGAVTLQYNGTNDLAINSPTTNFTFASNFNDGSSYNVSVLSATGGLTCVTGSNTGTISGGPVSNVTVNCSNTTTYQVGVNVAGYAGSTDLMLANNGVDLLGINANGISNFSVPMLSGSTYNFSVVQQPTGPKQSCVFTGAYSGTVSSTITIGMTCTTNTYTIGGAITGLANGEQITLQNNGGNDLLVVGAGSSYDTFEFTTQIADMGAYDVTVLTPPGGKTCTEGANTGSVAGGPVTTVVIGCTGAGSPLFTVGGAVTGLAAGNTVTLQNNLADDLNVTANGAFTFATALSDTDPYSVTVLTDPTTPNQTCSVVSGGSGNISAANVITVNINCVTVKYTVQGNVSGMNVGDSITLVNNGADPVTLNADGGFSFTLQDDGTGYNVTIQTMPATTTCTMGANSGTINGANVVTVSANCSSAGTFSIGGTLSGLMVGTSVQLSLNSGFSTTTLNSDGSYSFPKTLSPDTIYSVVVSANPTGPTQTCTVTNPNGTVSGTVNNINVNCVTNTYTISGSVAGLAVGENFPILTNGSTAVVVTGPSPVLFTTAAVNDATTPTLDIIGSPNNKICTFASNGLTSRTVTVSGGNVTGIDVNCDAVTTAAVSVNVTGLTGSGLTVINYVSPISGNSYYNNINVNNNGVWSFPVQAEYSDYLVLVATHPSGQLCGFAGANSGTMAGPAVAVNVDLNCIDLPTVCGNSITETGESCDDGNTASLDGCSGTCQIESLRTIGGNVNGLGNGESVTLKNGSESLVVTGNGADPYPFAFTTTQYDGTSYYVVLNSAAPAGKTCSMDIATQTGTVFGSDITNVTLNCIPIVNYTIGGTVLGLGAGKTATLTLNGGVDSQVVTGGGSLNDPYTFTVSIPNASNYSVVITAKGGGSTCVVGDAISGVVAGANVTNANFLCGLVADAYEADDSVGTAQYIAADGSFQTRSIHTSGNVDYLYFNVASTAISYSIETKNTTTASCTGVDTQMTLYDTDGVTQLFYNDDVDISGGIYCSSITYQFPSTGVYYIKVNGYTTSTFNYTIRVKPGVTIFSEDFTSNLGNFTAYDLGSTGTITPVEFKKWHHIPSTTADAYDYTVDPNWTTFWAPFSDFKFAAVNSYVAGSTKTVKSSIESTVIDCSTLSSVKLKYLTIYQQGAGGVSGQVQVKSSKTGDWFTKDTYTSVQAGFREIDISAEAAGESDVQIRFLYEGTYAFYWILDNVIVFGNN
jgi:cysteine-rich repeat protein